MNDELKRKIKIIVVIYVFFGMAFAGALQSFNKSFEVTNLTKFDTPNVMPFYVDLILSFGAVIAAIIQKIRVKGKFVPLFLLSVAIAIYPWYIIEPIIYNKFGLISILIIKNIEFLSIIALMYFLYKAFLNEESVIVDKHGRKYTLWDFFTTDFFRKEKQSDTSSTMNKKQ